MSLRHTASLEKDGWRAPLRTGGRPRVFSRHGTDLTRAMADVARTAERLPEAVLDCELLAVTTDGQVSFALLQSHSGNPLPGAGFSVVLAAFDLLATGDGTDRRALLPRAPRTAARPARRHPGRHPAHPRYRRRGRGTGLGRRARGRVTAIGCASVVSLWRIFCHAPAPWVGW